MSCCLKNYVKKTVVLTPLTPLTPLNSVLTPLTSVLAKLELRIKRSPLHSPWGSWRGAKDVFLEYIFAKFGVMRVFFALLGVFLK